MTGATPAWRLSASATQRLIDAGWGRQRARRRGSGSTRGAGGKSVRRGRMVDPVVRSRPGTGKGGMRILIAAALLSAWPVTGPMALCLPVFCGYFHVKNSCPHPVEVAVYYDDFVLGWRVDGYHRLRPGQEEVLHRIPYERDTARYKNWQTLPRHVPLRTSASSYYYYARSTDGSNFVWDGRNRNGGRWVRFGGESLLFRKQKDYWSDIHLKLTCSQSRRPAVGGGSGIGPRRL